MTPRSPARSRPLIRHQTIDALADWMAGWCTVRKIATLCRDVGLTRASTLEEPVTGERRAELALHLQPLDLTDERDVRTLLLLMASALAEMDLQLAALDESPAPGASTRTAALREHRTTLLRQLERDGYEYVGGELRATHAGAGLATLATHAVIVDLPYLREQIARLHAAVEDDPWLAIGTAKELVETVCKTILHERISDPDKQKKRNRPKFPALVTETRQALRLVPDEVPDGYRAAQTITTLLNSLGTQTQCLAELRNAFGTGHGADGRARGLKPRHARLAVGAAATLATFLLETHLERPAEHTTPPPSGAAQPRAAAPTT